MGFEDVPDMGCSWKGEDKEVLGGTECTSVQYDFGMNTELLDEGTF